MKQVSKASVNYRMAHNQRHCGSCAMFHPNSSSCDLVNGIIISRAVCDRWVAKKK